MPRTYAREEVLEACFADLPKGLVFYDQVMDWVIDALHQNTQTRSSLGVMRLLPFKTKIQNRLDKLYEDRLDGFIGTRFL